MEAIIEVRREAALLKTGALQNAIFNSANFSSIATDEKGVIQLFNVGAERMLGYTAADVLDKITPADISDPQEVIVRAKALSIELATPITPGFEALDDTNLAVRYFHESERYLVLWLAVGSDPIPMPIDHLGEFLVGCESLPPLPMHST